MLLIASLLHAGVKWVGHDVADGRMNPLSISSSEWTADLKMKHIAVLNTAAIDAMHRGPCSDGPLLGHSNLKV